MQHEGGTAGKGKRLVTVLLGQFYAQMFAVLLGLLQKTVGHVMMVNIDGTGIHLGTSFAMEFSLLAPSPFPLPAGEGESERRENEN